jgi:hypothetical protein
MILQAIIGGAVVFLVFWVASVTFEALINQSVKESQHVDDE